MGFIDRRLLTHINWGLLCSLLVLFLVGIGNLYSASGVRLEDGISLAPFYERQIIWGGLGLLAMLICMSFDYRHIQGMALPFFIFTLVSLCLIPVFGKVIYGARRWIDLGFFHFQPSEMAKLAVLLMGARVLALDGDPLSWKRLFQILGIGLLPAALIVLQPDLGTALTILALLGGMILYHGLQPKVLRTCLLTLPLLLPVAWFTMHDYQKQRIMTFLDPSCDPRGSGYHIIQSQIAIGSGQIWGKGFLQGTQSQLRFLPEKHTDFAIAVFGEEWGFVGCVILMALFCLFLLGIFNTVRGAKDRFGSTLAAGIFIYFFWQTFVNTGMVVGIMPVVGIPLPFLSYGGSATLVNFALVGLVLNISMRRFVFKS
ncbi:MAG: rod shape-determining protein RodA [Bilophila sp.]